MCCQALDLCLHAPYTFKSLMKDSLSLVQSVPAAAKILDRPIQRSHPCLQDLPKNSLDLLEGMFLFSLVWSIGATVDKDGRGAFNRFLRKMLHKGVSINPDRSDFDLGPGLTIQEPEWSISVPMPTVSRQGQQCS